MRSEADDLLENLVNELEPIMESRLLLLEIQEMVDLPKEDDGFTKLEIAYRTALDYLMFASLKERAGY